MKNFHFCYQHRCQSCLRRSKNGKTATISLDFGKDPQSELKICLMNLYRYTKYLTHTAKKPQKVAEKMITACNVHFLHLEGLLNLGC